MPEINKHEEAEFKKAIDQAVSEGRHVDYLKDVLKKYDYYQKVFSGIFTLTASKTDVYIFEVLYESDSKVSRVIQVLGSQNFEDLAGHIILSMGWVNDHMHGFDLIGKKLLPDPFYTAAPLSFFAEGWEDDPYPTYKSSQILISNIDYKKQPTLEFTFDYGDGHCFKISFLERIKKEPIDRLKDFPRLIESHGVSLEQYPAIPDF
jgi:Plasmid pRiA4b ORF-3-like protein